MSTTAQVPNQLFSDGEVSTTPTVQHAGDQLFSNEEVGDSSKPNPYLQQVNTGPLSPSGQAEKTMGASIGDNKAQEEAALKATGEAAVATGAGIAGSEAAAPAMRYIGQEWGPSAVKAIAEAEKSHPVVAKVLLHGLEGAGLLKLGQYMKVFGK